MFLRLITILIFISPFVYSQQNVLDSLLKQNEILTGEEKVLNLIRISRWYVVHNDTSGIHFALEAIKNAEVINYKEGLGKAALFAGVSYDEVNVEKATYYYREAAKIFEELEHDWLGYCYTNLSKIYREKGWYPEAIDFGIKSLKIFENQGDSAQMALEITNLGYSYDRMGDYKLAIDYHKKALPVAIDYSDEITIGLIYGRIGIAYDELGMPDSAHYYNNIAADYYMSAEDFQSLAITLSNIGNTYLKSNNLSKAREYLNKALGYSELEYNQTIILINLANVYMKTGQLDRAEEYLDKGIAFSKKFQQVKFLSEAYYLKHELNQKRGDIASALIFFKKYNNLNDSILNEQKTEQVNQMRIRYETDQKEKELLIERATNEELAKDKAIAEIKVYNRNKWLIGISSLALILLFFGLYIAQRNKRKIQAEKDAEIIAERERGLKAVINAQEEERKRISRDLHDGIGQQLSGLKLGWQQLFNEIKTEISGKEKKIENLTTLLDAAAKDVRTISHHMMPRVLSESGLVPAIEDMLDKSLNASQIQYEFETYKVKNRFDEKIEISIYRVTQELINNIIKHSDAKFVNVQLFTNKGFLILMVEDNGKGFDVDSRSEGHGMLNIKSRINAINGEVSFDPSPGSGTVIIVRIPIDNSSREK